MRHYRTFGSPRPQRRLFDMRWKPTTIRRWLSFFWLLGAAFARSSEFEVASIRPNTSGDGNVMIGIQRGGRFAVQNMPARELIRFAYNVRAFQITGGPSWMYTDHYD